MEKLLKASDVAARYGVTEETGRAYIRRIPGHLERPLRVAERLLTAWEAGRTVWDTAPVTPAARTSSGAARPLPQGGRQTSSGAARSIPRRGRAAASGGQWIPGVSRIPARKD